MSGGSRIIAFGSSVSEETEEFGGETAAAQIRTGSDEEPPLELGAWLEGSESEFAEDRGSRSSALLPGMLALLVVAAWTGFYLWANRAALSAGLNPAEWPPLIAGWCLPVVLVSVVWLIAMRSSTREATRFGTVARQLSDESALLEARLLTVNRELSLAREFVAAQSRDLESLGRIASDRLSASADRLQTLVEENGDRVENIGRVSTAALDNMEKLRGQLPVIASSAKDVTNNIANAGRSAHSQIAAQMAEAKSRLSETETQLGSLTESGIRLFELLQRSAEQAGNVLPATIGQSLTALTEIENRAGELIAALGNAERQGSELAASLDSSRGLLSDFENQLVSKQAQLRERTDEHLGFLENLLSSLAKIDERHEALATRARDQLKEAIAEMDGSARETLALIESQGAAGIERISSEIRSRSAEAVEQAIHNASAEISGQLQQAAAHASGVSREATIQLRDQLAKVHDLVANLESRVDHARDRAEEQVDNDFARRAALITESLNSGAIDIAKAFSAEVSDKAWEDYLRGDRGIFTRRAVSLIEASDSRNILQIFETDDKFRELVSRYIHDFESMLRQVLSTRDGKSLGVTLLSSDMGKLYVLLAQAIERLRT